MSPPPPGIWIASPTQASFNPSPSWIPRTTQSGITRTKNPSSGVAASTSITTPIANPPPNSTSGVMSAAPGVALLAMTSAAMALRGCTGMGRP